MDQTLISQALINLIKNAGEAIEIRQRKLGYDILGEIRISVEQTSMNVIIKIEDNGIGLPMNKEFLTEPYISRSKNGSGIGLAVVKKIMQDHNGNIELENNKDNKGAKVSLLFPIN